MSKPQISYNCTVIFGQFSLKNEERDGVNLQKNAKISLNLESYLNKATALEFFQVIRDSLLGEKNPKPKPAMGVV